MSKKFNLEAPYKPAGDQPAAITKLVQGLQEKQPRQTLLGVTGSGKTYTMANVIAATQKPALVISHNKTLTAQLTQEFKEFFPKNAVEYFVSYYDYYQPEAYIPRTDTYIAKDANINDEIDRLRHAALESVLTRRDTIIVASVSCIYGLGQPENYLNLRLDITRGSTMVRQELLRRLVNLQYEQSTTDLTRGSFRVRGDVVDIHPAGHDRPLRVEFLGTTIEGLSYVDALTGTIEDSLPQASIFPATFFLSGGQNEAAIAAIQEELKERVAYFEARGKAVEAQRIAERTTYDLEMLQQLGYVSGIENYSRHFDGRQPGQPPATLIDYFHYAYNGDYLTFIDESHMTIPQISAMQAGDKARKESLIRFGFRLPSAYDNRPLTFAEFEDRLAPTIFVSATPAEYEKRTSSQIVEQIVRPTGLLDPTIEVRPTAGQVDDAMQEIAVRVKKQQRVLVTTLTKRMAEELSTYLIEMGMKAAYIHSDVDTFDRLDILEGLRAGRYDVLVGINLLREGLDLPEVSLVTIMDADKEGYLRSATALIQIMGRAARHEESQVIMYGDRVTGSMQQAMDETSRRRKRQHAYNQKHNITPRSITKALRTSLRQAGGEALPLDTDAIPATERKRILAELTSKMELASRNLEFERAAELRDMIRKLRQSTRKK
jgi:excinuclease ABC subunit B